MRREAQRPVFTGPGGTRTTWINIANRQETWLKRITRMPDPNESALQLEKWDIAHRDLIEGMNWVSTQSKLDFMDNVGLFIWETGADAVTTLAAGAKAAGEGYMSLMKYLPWVVGAGAIAFAISAASKLPDLKRR